MEALTTYRNAVDRIITGLRYILQAIFASADYTDRERLIELLTAQLTEIVRQQRALVYAEAVVMLKSLAKLQGVDNPYVPSMSGYSDQAVRTLLRQHLRGTPQEVTQVMTAALAQHVEAAGRQAIIRAVEDGVFADNPEDEEHLEYTRLTPDEFAEHTGGGLRLVYNADDDERQTPAGRQPKSWARVLTGAENCGFCVMLASRGPVYSSAAEAGRGQASDSDYAAGINTYHTNCDCLVVPIYDYANWPGRDQWLAAERVYKHVISQKWSESYNAKHLREKWKKKGKDRKGIRAGYGPSGKSKNGKTNNVINAIERYLRSHDITDLYGIKNIRVA